MVKRTQHIGTFLHNEMGISIGGIFPMCGRSSIQRQKIFSLKPIEVFVEKRTMASPLTLDQCEALRPGYLLSALEVAEVVAVAGHLHTCDRCQASLVAYEAVCARLAQAVPPHEPPADLRQRLMAAVTDTLPLAA